MSSGGQGQTIVEDGTIKTDYIDVDKVVANALNAKTVNVEDATINNLTLGNADVSGKIVANLMYSPNTFLNQTGTTELKYTIDPIQDPCSSFLCRTQNGKLKIMLPRAFDYDGLELKFYYDRDFTSTYGMVVVFQSNEEESETKHIRSRRWTVLTSQEGVQFEAPDPTYYNDPNNPSSNNPYYATTVLLGFNQFVTFKAMGSTWYVDGKVSDATGYLSW